MGGFVDVAALLFAAAQRAISPLVLDLDGDGLDLVALADSRAFFDMDNDGFAERTGWVAPDDALLAMDRNGNGQIDNQSELFGGTRRDGFASLRALDGNRDGRIDAADADFANLRLWRDGNGDGVSQAAEMQSLAAAGVSSLSLASTYVSQTVAGNAVTDVSTYTRTDGASATLADVWFATDPRFTFDTRPFEVTFEAMLLPTLRGYGTISSLTAEMSRDPALLQMVKDFAAAPFALGAETDARVRAIMHRWAGVEEVDPASRGPNIDARDLAFLERFFDDPFQQLWFGGNPHEDGSATLNRAFDTILDAVKARLIAQGPLADVFGPGAYDYLADGFTTGIDLQAVLDRARDACAALDGGLVAKTAWWTDMLVFLDEVAGDALPEVAANYEAGADAAIRASTGFAFRAADLRGAASWTPVAGAEGNDTANGAYERRDLMLASTGDDRMIGSGGNDVYVWGPGAGADTVFDYLSYGDADRLVLATELASTGVSVKREGYYLDSVRLSFAGHAGSVLLDDEFYHPSSGVEFIQFGDGVVWTKADLQEAYFAGRRTAGDDVIEGFRGANTYRCATVDGHDTIREKSIYGGDDELVFGPGLASGDLCFLGAVGASGLRIGFRGGAGTITLDEQFNGGGIERFRFADGVAWDLAEFQATYIKRSQTAGDDTICGFKDSTAFAVGSLAGHDTISARRGLDDRLVLGADLVSTAAVVTRNGNHATLRFDGAAGSVTLTDGFHGDGWGVDRVRFGDGAVWGAAELRAAHFAASQTAGNDTVNGFNGADTFTVGALAGHDTIVDGRVNQTADLLVFGGAGHTSGAVVVARNGHHAKLAFAGEAGSVALADGFRGGGWGVDQVRFADGAVWGVAELRAAHLAGARTAGGDSIQGFDGADTLDGGAGADSLHGGGGADLFRYAAGDSTAAARDTLFDFSAAGGDRIDLASIDADGEAAGDQAFAWLGVGAALNGARGALAARAVGADLEVLGDADGDGAADLAILLKNTATLSASAFVL